MAFSFTDYASMKPGEDRFNPLAAILQGAQQRTQMQQQRAALQQSILANQKQQAQSKFWSNPLYQGNDQTKMIGALIDAGLIKPEQISGAQAQVGQADQSQLQQYQQQLPQPQQQQVQQQSQDQQSNGATLQNGIQQNMGLFNTKNPALNNFLNAPTQSKIADTNYKNTLTRNWAWDHATPEAKAYQEGQGAAMGIDPGTFLAEINKGKAIGQIAQEHGFDPNNLPDPAYLATKTDVTKLHTRQAALKEIDTMSDFITKSIAPYSKQFSGYSPAQISDALSGINPDKQADYLAAQALAPELANIRLQLAQGRTGKGAMDEIMQKSLLNVKNFGFTVSPEIFTKMQNRMDQILKKSFGRAESIYNAVKKNPSNKSTNENDPLGLL